MLQRADCARHWLHSGRSFLVQNSMTHSSLPRINRAQLYAVMAQPSSLVIAANRRLVRDCHWRYGQWQQAKEQSVWPTPQVATLNDFLLQQWQQQVLTADGDRWPQPERILSAREMRRLWQTLIAQQEGERTLLRVSETASLAAEAFELEIAFQLPMMAQVNEEVQRYQKWKQSFIAFCQKKNWLTSAQWQQQVLHALAESTLLQRSFVLLGFDDEPPLLRQFCALVHAQGGTLTVVSESQKCTHERRYTPLTREHEREWAVRFAIQQAEAGQRVAIVVPDLAAQRIAMERVLLRWVHPAAARDFKPLNKGQFNVSAGASLYSQPMVQQGILLARMAMSARDWSLQNVSVLLHSPFIGDYQHDAFLRARLDVKWRAIGNDSVRISHALAAFEQQGLVTLHTAFVNARAYGQSWPSRQLPSQWAECLQRLLQTLGWPGTRALDSVAYQLRSAFDEALQDCALLDDLTGVISVDEALSLLTQIAHDEIFQPQANAQAPIQVLGMLEASGQRFDAVWVVNASDEQFPCAPKPNPFIAVAWQRQHGLPRSSIEHEWHYVQRWQHSLRHSCNTLVWSCAAFDGDQHLRASALINDVEWADDHDSFAPPLPLNVAPLETIWHEEPVPLMADETISGGVDVLRLQARDPLAAFAQFRLNAVPVAGIESFTTPRVHGLLLHASLQHFWTTHCDQHSVQAMSAHARDQAIEQCIAQAFITVEQKEGRVLPPVWRRLEQALLQRVLNEWLDYELTRPPFRVLYCEQKHEWSYQHWSWHTRIDRVDINEQENLLVIDYKSGSAPSPQQWNQSPLLEPQLPLYALLLGESVSAIGFAQLKRGDMKWLGRAQDEQWGRAFNIDDEWSAWRVRWKSEIENLAAQFVQGKADNRYAQWTDVRDLAVRPFLRLTRLVQEQMEHDE